MKRHILFLMIIAFAIITGCDKESPLMPTEPESYVSFSVKDEGGEAVLDSAATNQTIMLIGRLTGGIHAASWRFNWGDGSQEFSGTGDTIMSFHKYTVEGTYTITLYVTTPGGANYQYTKQFRIYSYTQNMKPVYKVISAVQISPNTWRYTRGYLRQAVECGYGNIFYVDTNSNWQPRYIGSDTTQDGYYTDTMTIVDNQVHAFTYGGNWNNCYASIEPRPPFWGNAYIKYINGVKMYTRHAGGIAYVVQFGGSGSGLPGTVGDSIPGTTLVTRFGLGMTTDTVYIYMCKLRANGASNPTWANNLTGFNNPQTIYDVAGYTDWWYAKIAVSSVPVNTPLQYFYQTASGLANMSGSYFWDYVVNKLSVQISSIGDSVIIKVLDPDTKAVMQQYILRK